MVSIREEIGDVLEPDDEEDTEEDFQDDNHLSYPIHYSQGNSGNWSILNFSEPYGEKQLIPDYTAKKLYQDEEEVWEVSAEARTVEVSIEPGIDSKDKLADELKSAYHEKV